MSDNSTLQLDTVKKVQDDVRFDLKVLRSTIGGIWGSLKRTQKRPDLDGLLGDFIPIYYTDEQLRKAYYEDPVILYEPYSKLLKEWQRIKNSHGSDSEKLERFHGIEEQIDVILNDLGGMVPMHFI